MDVNGNSNSGDSSARSLTDVDAVVPEGPKATTRAVGGSVGSSEPATSLLDEIPEPSSEDEPKDGATSQVEADAMQSFANLVRSSTETGSDWPSI